MRTILLVDDDFELRQTIAETLGDHGYRVVSAANGRDALDLLRKKLRPELILLDVMMPEMNGWAFRTAQQSAPDLASIPVVVFSACRDVEDVAASLRVAGYLKKPVSLEELLGTVRKFASANTQ